MKANVAPEKIYLDLALDALTRALSEKTEDDVEYTRTDAFIDKACNYLRNHIDKDLTIYHEQTWCKRDEFIKKFCKYMKGE